MELFDNMIAFDYTQRPSISEIRQNNWMKEINWELIPLLKQEFILREEKINFNISKTIKNNKNSTNIFRPDIFEINIIKNVINKSLINDKVNEENFNKDKTEGKINIKTTSINLRYLLRKIINFFKKRRLYKIWRK